MNLSDIKTEDGGTLEQGGVYYAISVGEVQGTFVIRPCILTKFVDGAVYTLLSPTGRVAIYPVVNGRVVSIWHDREVLEAGLGQLAAKGVQA